LQTYCAERVVLSFELGSWTVGQLDGWTVGQLDSWTVGRLKKYFKLSGYKLAKNRINRKTTIMVGNY
jgi:hypothetical protein